jgi:hypothetical protein
MRANSAWHGLGHLGPEGAAHDFHRAIDFLRGLQLVAWIREQGRAPARQQKNGVRARESREIANVGQMGEGSRSGLPFLQQPQQAFAAQRK